MNLDAVVVFLVQHQSILLGLVFWPLLTAVMNIMLRKKSAAEWEAWAMSKPALALLVEMLRALGLDPAKLLLAFQRFAQRRAGVIPADAVRASGLPPSVQRALLDPEMVQAFHAVVETMEAMKKTPPTGAPPSDPPPAPPAA